jgi:ketosteroid isomerase-like protein
MIFSISVQSQNQEVQKAIEDFFVAFHAKDTVKLKSICSDKIILQSIQENTNEAKLSDESTSEFYKSIASIPENFNFQEKILSYSIQVDGSMAHAWTPYEFYINDKLSHKGVNAFTLFKENNEWKIIYCIDTRRKR